MKDKDKIKKSLRAYDDALERWERKRIPFTAVNRIVYITGELTKNIQDARLMKDKNKIKIGFLEGAHPIAAELTTCGLLGVEPQIVAVL